MAHLRLENITKNFGTTKVLQNVSLDFNGNQFVVFVGPSGCGKSTLLRTIAGLEEVTDGAIYIDGEDVTSAPPVDRDISMVFQSYALYPQMTVEENMSFGLKVAKVAKKEADDKVTHASQMLQLGEYLKRKPKELSGGQRQRVAIGRCIVRNPKIFLFDEPLSNLDAELRVEMRIQISQLHKRLNSTMIYVTHDQVEAMTLADKVVVLRDGQVEQVGSPIELYENPDNIFVAGFIGSPKMNFVDALIRKVTSTSVEVQLQDEELLCIQGRNSDGLEENQSVVLGIRPEAIHVQSNAQLSGDLVINATINYLEVLGSLSYLYCNTQNITNLVVQQLGYGSVKQGDQVRLSIASDKCYLFDAKTGAAICR